MTSVPSQELRTLPRMFVVYLTVKFKFLNRFICSNRPTERAGKVLGDSQDLKPPGESCLVLLVFMLFAFAQITSIAVAV